eukprot:TRINITY_DN901_c0_g1_i1.p1 TRINITY_DN901_c0_g1~~TRINITY_DN901_c0_g1_i1.p1  ORF type:complete len:187 (-),score=40.71 TRINITY_DN901_c0_g1_i1:68-628(-)
MKVQNAQDGLSLLLLSKRIAFDLALDLKFESEFSLKIIVRPWTDIPLWGEFRAFVNNNKMTAVSQYFSQLYFPELSVEKTKRELLEGIKVFWTTRIAPHTKTLGGGKYSVDFVVDTAGNVAVLEFNPFMISTSSCLFDWADDDVVLHGEAPFQFKVHTKSLLDDPKSADKIRTSIPPEWVPVVFQV